MFASCRLCFMHALYLLDVCSMFAWSCERGIRLIFGKACTNAVSMIGGSPISSLSLSLSGWLTTCFINDEDALLLLLVVVMMMMKACWVGVGLSMGHFELQMLRWGPTSATLSTTPTTWGFRWRKRILTILLSLFHELVLRCRQYYE